MLNPFTFDTSARATSLDVTDLRARLVALDSSAVVYYDAAGQSCIVDKSTAWTQAQVNAVKNAITNSATLTSELDAQYQIDAWPVVQRALVLALIDQLNVIRAALPTPLPDITPAQALAAVRAKAGTL
jgi:esterase/lipase superfamily enzyme